MSALSGLASVTGQIVTSAGPVAFSFRGMGFAANGALVTANAPGAVPRDCNGSVDVVRSLGAVAVDAAGVVANYVGGLPITAAGDLAVTVGVPNSYDQGVGFVGERVAIA